MSSGSLASSLCTVQAAAQLTAVLCLTAWCFFCRRLKHSVSPRQTMGALKKKIVIKRPFKGFSKLWPCPLTWASHITVEGSVLAFSCHFADLMWLNYAAIPCVTCSGTHQCPLFMWSHCSKKTSKHHWWMLEWYKGPNRITVKRKKL